MSKRCTQCCGSGDMVCESCGGRGLSRAAEDQDIECQACEGLGTIDCPTCNGIGIGVFTFYPRENIQYTSY
jgi:hypothetical protein